MYSAVKPVCECLPRGLNLHLCLIRGIGGYSPRKITLWSSSRLEAIFLQSRTIYLKASSTDTNGVTLLRQDSTPAFSKIMSAPTPHRWTSLTAASPKESSFTAKSSRDARAQSLSSIGSGMVPWNCSRALTRTSVRSVAHSPALADEASTLYLFAISSQRYLSWGR